MEQLKRITLITLCIVIVFRITAQQSVVILHTNDLHSQMGPLTSGDNAGLGGMVRIAALVEEERKEEPDLFLFDAGDFWAGTPYFNFYNGKAEIDIMNAMGYDAVTLGNHQFDIPLNHLAQRLSEAEFKVVLSNYDVRNTPLKNFVKPYAVIEKRGIKIGVVGVCLDLKGLAVDENFEGMIYKDPIKSADKAARKLKRMGCKLIVCLSHLGYEEESEIDDIRLAANSRNIDIIIGGHTHVFLEKPDTVLNRKAKPVTIVQMGKSGAYVGRIDIQVFKKIR